MNYLYQERRRDNLKAKLTVCKQFKPSGTELGFTKEQADEMIVQKEKKEKEAETQRQHNAFIKIWCMKRDSKHAEGVTARAEKRARAQKFKELFGQSSIILSKLLVPIFDSEAHWKATEITWLALEAEKARKKKISNGNRESAEGDEDEEITFIVNTVRNFQAKPALRGDSALQ